MNVKGRVNSMNFLTITSRSRCGRKIVRMRTWSWEVVWGEIVSKNWRAENTSISLNESKCWINAGKTPWSNRRRWWPLSTNSSNFEIKLVRPRFRRAKRPINRSRRDSWVRRSVTNILLSWDDESRMESKRSWSAQHCNSSSSFWKIEGIVVSLNSSNTLCNLTPSQCKIPIDGIRGWRSLNIFADSSVMFSRNDNFKERREWQPSTTIRSSSSPTLSIDDKLSLFSDLQRLEIISAVYLGKGTWVRESSWRLVVFRRMEAMSKLAGRQHRLNVNFLRLKHWQSAKASFSSKLALLEKVMSVRILALIVINPLGQATSKRVNIWIGILRWSYQPVSDPVLEQKISR